jgi:hypothetical protein
MRMFIQILGAASTISGGGLVTPPPYPFETGNDVKRNCHKFLSELDRISSQRAEQLPPFRTFLDTLARRERQQLTRRPEHNNNRVHMRSRRDGFIWTYEYMPHMQYYQEPP